MTEVAAPSGHLEAARALYIRTPSLQPASAPIDSGKIQGGAVLPSRKIVVLVGAAVAAGIVFILTGSTTSLLLALVGPILIQVQSSLQKEALLSKFEEDYPSFLNGLYTAVRVGIDLIQAIEASAAVLPSGSIVAREAKKLTGRIQSGETQDEAIAKFGNQIPHKDLPVFISALLLARREGTALSTSLERISRTTRSRQSFRRQLRAAVKVQSITMRVLLGMAVAVPFALTFLKKEIMTNAWNDPVGHTIILAAACALVGAAILVWKVGKTEY